MDDNIQKDEIESVLKSIVTHMPVGLIIVECENGKPIFVNDQAKCILEIDTIDDLRNFFRNYDIKICGIEREERREIKLQSNNTYKIVGLSVYNTPNDLMERSLSFIFLKDISKLKEQEKMLRENFESEFARKIAGSIAHEIGNPLSALKVSLKLILDNINNYDINKIRNMLSSMLEEVDKVDRFLKDFLMYARTKHLHLEPADFCDILEDVLSLMNSSFKANNITVINRCCKESRMVNVDSRRLRQVLINILKNSVEAIVGKGFIIISCTSVSYREHKMLKVEITDTGVGIKKDHIPRIFSPFFTTKIYGSGLGLTAAREMLERMGGNISIESEEGKGTTVTILLPFY